MKFNIAIRRTWTADDWVGASDAISSGVLALATFYFNWLFGIESELDPKSVVWAIVVIVLSYFVQKLFWFILRFRKNYRMISAIEQKIWEINHLYIPEPTTENIELLSRKCQELLALIPKPDKRPHLPAVLTKSGLVYAHDQWMRGPASDSYSEMNYFVLLALNQSDMKLVLSGYTGDDQTREIMWMGTVRRVQQAATEIMPLCAEII